MNYKIKVREEWCKGCDICVDLCPKNVFDKADKISNKGIVVVKVSREEDCIGCQICANHCPDMAITVTMEEVKEDVS